MLAGLFRGAIAELVDEALASALAGSPAASAPLPRVAVVGDVALGRALLALQKRRAEGGGDAGGRRRFELAIIAEPGARAAKKLEGVLTGSPAQLPLGDGELAAIVGVGALAGEPAAALRPLLEEWTRVVRDGGGVVLVDRAPRTTATRHALCAGLSEIEQRASGRAVVTSGLLTKLPA
jgi:hypothetical protein